uniref:Epidermal growth factor receptor pathway substrate 15 n=1 Tax=Gadus morhua TaxID=8049 RepID=A0A8C5AEX9_GADMO
MCMCLWCGVVCVSWFCLQVDPAGSGRVAAADAALFLKRSGLADLVLGKVWDLADSERKGCLNKQQFFIALRLVACAQNGLEVALKSLHLAVPPPKFNDTSSPQLTGGGAMDIPWFVKAEEKMKFDTIFDSLFPVGGYLTGDKVKPVLLNSKLPVDVLGRVWELSDIDRDGMLERDEFAVAMYLVYRALEGEPVPMSLPPPLVPPSKRKKPTVPSGMPLLPSPRLSCVPRGPSQWVVSPADKAKYDELFSKTDGDMDGLVSGPEVRDIFLKTGLPSATLARIWELCDIGDLGKLTREQFALALHLINQRLTKGLEPPQTLSAEMIPPSDRLSIKQQNMANLAADFSAIKELDSLSNEIVDLQREKSGVEQEIKEKEETIQQRTSEVQELQDVVSRESLTLQQLHAERQRIQEAVDELDLEKSSLEGQLSHIRQQTSQESQLITSLQSEHEEQEITIGQYEEALVQAREELLKLQEETRLLEEKVQGAREQLTPLQESVRDSFKQVTQVRAASFSSVPLSGLLHRGDLYLDEDHPFHELKEEEDEEEEEEEEFSPARSHPMKEQGEEEQSEDEEEEEEEKVDEGTEKTESERLQSPEEKKARQDPLDDLFRGELLCRPPDPFGEDPFKGSDPFAADAFFAQPGEDPFAGSGAGPAEPDPFGASLNNAAGAPATAPDPFATNLSGASTSNDLFGTAAAAAAAATGSSNGADAFGTNNKNIFQDDTAPTNSDVPPALPPKTGTPTRPPPPPPGERAPKHPHPTNTRLAPQVGLSQYPTEDDMIEWAKRESEREEKARLARLTQQEQEDLELAIALSKSELS